MTFDWRIVGAVAVGSALGALIRFAISLAMLDMAVSFPWPTLVANVVGSLLIGWIAARSERGQIGPAAYQFAVTGFCGGLTTFSLFSLELFALLDEAAYAGAALYLSVSLLLWLGAVWVGYAIGQGRRG